MIQDQLIMSFIIIGAIIMVANIVWYVFFMKNMQDVLSRGRKTDNYFLIFGLVLLVFFLLGYIFVSIYADPHIVTSLILLFGSIFVTVMLLITTRLLLTAKERSLQIAEMLIGVIDARDPNLDGHSNCVKDVAMLLYKRLPLPMRMTINSVSLEFAALMHDVGKLGIPESILNKPAKLDEKEWELMREHPRIGVKILKPIKTFDVISDWILYHHERADGNGYYKIPADQVPLASKIIAVADTYSAITMRRSYKPPRTHEDAIEIIKDIAGKQLDQYLVEVFLTIPKDELINCIPEKVKY